MQNIGNSNYSGDFEGRALAAAGRTTASQQSEGDGDEAYKTYGTGGAQTDYAARAAMTNSEPMRKG